MNVIILPPADKELEDTIEFYNTQLPGLGDQFYREFLFTIDLLQRTPFGWKKLSKNTRRINIKRFPFLLLYVIQGNNILLLVLLTSIETRDILSGD